MQEPRIKSFILDAFSDATWLTPTRARLGTHVLAACTALVLLGLISVLLFPAAGKPIALDFDAFWAASRLALAGHPQGAYDHLAIEKIERSVAVMRPGYTPFYYPPSFLLICLPLGLLPYVPALLIFVGAQGLLFVSLLRRILPPGWAALPILIFPGFAVNALSGQNGGLTGACFAGAMLLLERRPLLGGACLGLLSCKPQLAVAVPVALAAARRWRALCGAGATSVGLAGVAWMSLGPEAFRGFLVNTQDARSVTDHLPIKWQMMQSPYAAARLLGSGAAAGYALQSVFAVASLTVMARLAWRRPGAGAEMALLSTAALLVTPYLFDYDLACLGVPLAWIVMQAQQGGWRAGEKTMCLLLYLLPLAARGAGTWLGMTLAPLPILGLLGLLARRAWRPAHLVAAAA